jgi:hypothetical protein
MQMIPCLNGSKILQHTAYLKKVAESYRAKTDVCGFHKNTIMDIKNQESSHVPPASKQTNWRAEIKRQSMLSNSIVVQQETSPGAERCTTIIVSS